MTTAADGTGALAAAGPGPDTRFAAVVLDIGLPDSDGRDVCQALRARGMDVPVLFLTARDQLHDVLAGFAAGGDDHLAKPVPRQRAARPGRRHGAPRRGPAGRRADRACTWTRPTTRSPARPAGSRSRRRSSGCWPR